MPFVLVPMEFYKLLLLAGAVVSLVLVGIAWERRRAPGAPALIVLLLASVWWLLCYAVPLTGMSHDDATFLRARLIFPGVVIISPATLAFVLRYTGRVGRMRWPMLALLAIEPAMVVTAVALPSLHSLFYGEWRGAEGQASFRPGPLFWAHSLYSYALLAKAAGVLLRHYKLGNASSRRQTSHILIAMFLPLVCNLVFLLGVLPKGVDPTPLGLVATGAVLSLALLGRGLFDLVSLANRNVGAVITDGMAVLDAERRIVDVNASLWRILGLARPPHGCLLLQCAPELDAHVARVGPDQASHELRRGQSQFLELRIFAIHDDDAQLSGHLLLVRDITAAKHDALALETVNLELRAQLLRNEAMQQQLREQVIRDALTGLYNRRFLAEALRREMAQCQRDGGGFALVMLDVDHFKSINDEYGHAFGDAMLQGLGALLLEGSRPSDAPCRYGGEEFAVILSNTSLEPALRRVDEWRTGFAGMAFHVKDEAVRRTFSAGVAMYPADGKDEAALLAAADGALYRAKAEGRNRVRPAAPDGGLM